MAAVQYLIGLAASPGDTRPDIFQHSVLQQVSELGISDIAEVKFVEIQDLNHSRPAVGVVFWSTELQAAELESAIEGLRQADAVLIPVMKADESFSDLPEALRTRNATTWVDDGRQIASACLRELGLHENTRAVFISHRRRDGRIVAEQLYDAFSKAGWRPFVDRFEIGLGAEFQERIEEALEECAFLLLVETPEAADSAWVQHEVMFALGRSLGVGIVNVDGARHFQGTSDLPRHSLASPTSLDGSHIVLSPEAIEEITGVVEGLHAVALARRRRQLLVSAMAAARSGGRSVEPAPGWRMLLRTDTGTELLGVVPHLPVPNDLYEIANAGAEVDRSILVHAAHVLGRKRRELLNWVVGDRSIELVPNNAIGSWLRQ